jgi:predicted DNA-binding transcriptional regulator AlpA
MLAWMHALGLKPSQAAEALGISRRQIYKYMNGDQAIPKPIAKLAELLQERDGK